MFVIFIFLCLNSLSYRNRKLKNDKSLNKIQRKNSRGNIFTFGENFYKQENKKKTLTLL